MTFYLEILACLFIVVVIIGLFCITPEDKQRILIMTIRIIKKKDEK